MPKSYVNTGASRGVITNNKREENKGPAARNNSKGLRAPAKPSQMIGARGGAGINRNPPIVNEAGAARQVQRNLGLPSNQR